MLEKPEKHPQISRSINRILARFDRSSGMMLGKIGVEWLWDAAQDIRYAHRHDRLADVLHIFHKEWYGIRAASGSLPGRKLAIPEMALSDVDLNILALEIQDENPSRIVFHGFSHNMEALVRTLHDAGLGDRLFLVFHGSPAQWWNEVERRLVFAMIELAQAGLFRRIHIMKNGMELPDAPLFAPLLYNLSPLHSGQSSGIMRSEKISAFIPGWGNWIKNVFGSAYGASLSKNIEEVWAFASGLQLPAPLNDKLVMLEPSGREETFKRYLASHLTLNVSLIDCHPMVNVESQSLGRPCIRSDLNLDRYEDHEYVRLVMVNHNNSPSDIRSAVDRVLSVPRDEMSEMIHDYQSKIDALGIERYSEFLEI